MLRLIYSYAYTPESAIKEGNLLATQILTQGQQKNCKLMEYAAKYGQLHICKWLDENKYRSGKYAVQMAAREIGHKPVVKYLLENGAEFDNFVLVFITNNKHWNIVRYIIKHSHFNNSDPDYNEISRFVIKQAYTNKIFDIVELLIKKKIKSAG